jgi:hypothetical protein
MTWFNFIHADSREDDVEMLFGEYNPHLPIRSKNEVFVFYEEPFTLADCVVQIGAFPSLTQARKNNWGGEIPEGYKGHKIGKRFFWTYRPREHTGLDELIYALLDEFDLWNSLFCEEDK